ncbi:hypothetical protein AB0I54_14575 [Streptomyces sp. NPDC050625]|uniref:hypothetical protein n=1 Tax=Streptomyces sp. NPDC050625 TaxID=3154629 RepID=UPI00343C5F28
MKITARRTMFVPATAFLLCTALAGPAWADDETPPLASTASAQADTSAINTSPPEEPDESTTDVPSDEVDKEPAGPAEPKPLPGDVPAFRDCAPAHGVYIPTKQGRQYHKAVGPRNSNHNATSRTAKSTFTSEVTGEVGVSVSTETDVSINTMLLKIKQKFDVTVSAKLTAKLGNSISVDTPPHKTTNAVYGVWRLKHTGKSYWLHQNCTTTPEKTVVSYSPYRVGWYLWEG